MTSLREHLEAIRNRHGNCTVYVDGVAAIVWCKECGQAEEWPCADHRDAAAALAILNAADHYYQALPDLVRLVPDPEPSA